MPVVSRLSSRGWEGGRVGGGFQARDPRKFFLPGIPMSWWGGSQPGCLVWPAATDKQQSTELSASMGKDVYYCH